MAKTRAQKQEVIESLVDKFSNAKSAVFVDYKGISVTDAADLRQQAKDAGGEYLVAAKTLIQKALEQSGDKKDLVDPTQLEGNIALIFGFEDEVAPAKIAYDFGKGKEVFEIRGGIMGAQFMELSQVEALAKLPSREELLAKVVGSLNAPVSGFVNVLAGNLRGLVNVLNAVKDQKA